MWTRGTSHPFTYKKTWWKICCHFLLKQHRVQFVEFKKGGWVGLSASVLTGRNLRSHDAGNPSRFAVEGQSSIDREWQRVPKGGEPYGTEYSGVLSLKRHYLRLLYLFDL
jgi:hypothetical protein